MKKWKNLTVALAGIAACVGLIGSPAMVQAKEDSAKAVLQTQTVSESDQTEAELSAVKAVKLNADKVGETTSYNDMMYSPEKNGIYFVHTVGEVYGNYRTYEIVFYDISKNTYTTVYTSERGVEESYMDDNAIYFAKTDVSYTNNENTGTYDCTCDLEITNYNFKTGTVNKQAFETLDIGANWANPISTFGVDSYGRVFIATNVE